MTDPPTNRMNRSREILRLSDQQFRILDMLDGERRVAWPDLPVRARPSWRPRRRDGSRPRASTSCSRASTGRSPNTFGGRLGDEPRIHVAGFHQLCHGPG
jgi:hypothetical protein